VITRQTKLQLLVFAVLAVVGLLFTGARYAGLSTLVPGHDNGYVVNADFSDSGGIFSGAEVTFRGVVVGKVEQLTLQPVGVRVAMRLKPGSKLSSQTRAMIANRSAVGEQYIDLLPEADGAPYLHKGSVIPLAMTSIPIQPTQLLVNLDRLVKSVNTGDVGIVLDELGTAFEGSGTDLQRLVDASDALTMAATQNLPQTIKLIRDSRPVLDTQRAESGNFKAYNRDLASLTQQLRASDPDFRSLFTNGTNSALATTDLLESNRAALPPLLDNLISTAQVQDARLSATRQILSTYPNVIAGGFTVTPGDGTAHFGAATTMTAPPCSQGYGSTQRRDPADTSVKPPNINAYCSLPKGSASSDRGAQNAPRPGGTPAFPHDTNGASPVSLLGSSASQGDTALLADFNPTTGRSLGTGQQWTLEHCGVSDALFNAASWQWLLADPLRTS
jgi:phospholipid/cholesterol/gamma-HCH transport system substrate-binding protein